MVRGDLNGSAAAAERLPVGGLLRCPACHAAIDENRPCPGCGSVHRSVGGAPVLIDFAHSICDPADYADLPDAARAAPARGSLPGRALARITYGRSRTTIQAFDRFAAELKARSPEPLVLIVGGGTQGVGIDRLADPAIRLLATDIYPSPAVRVICDAHALPFRDGSFDAVVIQAVLEHVLTPERVVGEIARVLKADGLVLAETPFMQQVHMGAHDFTRFTFSGHRWLFRDFEQLDAGMSLGPGIALLWSISYYLKALTRSARLAAVLTAPLFGLRLLESRLDRRAAMEAGSGFYFIGRKSPTPLHPRAMRAYRSGS